MTYIPNVLTKNDSNNTFLSQTTAQTGIATLTTGYESINITIDSYDEDSVPGGLEIQFSPDTTFTTYYSDTYYKNTVFNKSYKILNKYYRIIYTPPSSGTSSFNLTTILNTNTISNTSTINNYYSNNNDSMFDAFSKIRVSNPNTLLDIKFPSQSNANGGDDFLDNKCLLCTKTTGATPEITRGDSKKIISINGAGDFISQSRKYCVYQPGKSQLVLLSGILKDSSAGSAVYENYIGYFDDNNGLFFKYDTTNNISINLRSSSSSTTSIIQSLWNIDKLDGTGTSGYNLDFEKSQLFVIDFEWLSVGRIRFGFYIFGKIYYCHQIHNVNELDGPYMKTANLPIRYQINVTSGTAKLTQICSSVISEGGYNPIGKSFSISNGTSSTSGISVGTSSTGIIAIRGSDVSNKYNHENILPTELSILDDSKRIMLIQIRLYHADALPTVNADSWTQVNDNSVVQYATSDISNLTVSHIVLKQFYVSEQSNFTLNLDSIFNNFLQITSDIDNTSDILVITGQTVSGSGKVYASLGWQEIY